MDDDEEGEKPEWATCMSSKSITVTVLANQLYFNHFNLGLKSLEGASTPEESLESLKQLALFIDGNDLSDMNQIGKGVCHF